MKVQIQRLAITVGLIVAAPFASAQQSPDKSAMPGMSATTPKSATQHMSGMDMPTMMKQCADMRKNMKPGAAMTRDMQKMMSECDEMDKSMTAPEQPYVPPADRRR
jgi:hypothetical protein